MPQCSEIKDVCISQGLNAEIEVRFSYNVLIFKHVIHVCVWEPLCTCMCVLS